MTEDEIKEVWQEFREFTIKKHSLLPDYEPHQPSVIEWEEFKNENSINKVA